MTPKEPNSTHDSTLNVADSAIQRHAALIEERLRAHLAAPSPAAQADKGKALRRETLLHVATLLLMAVLSLSTVESLTQANSVPTIIPTILISCSQVLIIISIFL